MGGGGGVDITFSFLLLSSFLSFSFLFFSFLFSSGDFSFLGERSPIARRLSRELLRSSGDWSAWRYYAVSVSVFVFGLSCGEGLWVGFLGRGERLRLAYGR